MIIFRKDQLDAFNSVADTDFERILAGKLMELFPRSKRAYGEPALGLMVRGGLANARKLGLEREEDMLRYLGAVLLLGSGFDTDPQLRWAAAALLTPPGVPAPQRVAALWEQTRPYANRVNGADNRFYATALRSLEGKTVETLLSGASRSSRDLFMLLSTIHPQKVQEAGESAIHDLTRFAVESCRTWEILDRECVALMTVLMFLFGAGMMSDPLTAWAPETLKKSGAVATERKLGLLLDAAALAAGRIAG